MESVWLTCYINKAAVKLTCMCVSCFVTAPELEPVHFPSLCVALYSSRPSPLPQDGLLKILTSQRKEGLQWKQNTNNDQLGIDAGKSSILSTVVPSAASCCSVLHSLFTAASRYVGAQQKRWWYVLSTGESWSISGESGRIVCAAFSVSDYHVNAHFVGYPGSSLCLMIALYM